MRFVVVDTCPAPSTPAPYIEIVLRDAGLTASSIYRGDDKGAAKILKRYGHHSQRQLSGASPAQRRAWGVTGTPNRPGFSEHELKSDGVGKPHHPAGDDLPDWMQGVDAGANTEHDRDAITKAARKHGWKVVHHYPAGVEYHHWCFAERPRPKSHKMRARVLALRAKQLLRR